MPHFCVTCFRLSLPLFPRTYPAIIALIRKRRHDLFCFCYHHQSWRLVGERRMHGQCRFNLMCGRSRVTSLMGLCYASRPRESIRHADKHAESLVQIVYPAFAIAISFNVLQWLRCCCSVSTFPMVRERRGTCSWRAGGGSFGYRACSRVCRSAG
ncbi:unnamed protein product [Periconia digitata]|uniref:Uncharacterized protein n=1 Tax=Periconia digitata TaxID=1303443 RepID=A0A9W4U2H6_9PLEO|nr:unnamed protein product [Periconia digitata]